MSSVIFHKQDLTKLTPVSSKFQRLNHADFLKGEYSKYSSNEQVVETATKLS